mmetsp:Transcript_22164/g.49023  ORF Transcript_22164/g.49023 Transcript_22164/m.49023 type:complete len:457 (+) Transcript_22164:373-1743(+)
MAVPEEGVDQICQLEAQTHQRPVFYTELLKERPAAADIADVFNPEDISRVSLDLWGLLAALLHFLRFSLHCLGAVGMLLQLPLRQLPLPVLPEVPEGFRRYQVFQASGHSLLGDVLGHQLAALRRVLLPLESYFVEALLRLGDGEALEREAEDGSREIRVGKTPKDRLLLLLCELHLRSFRLRLLLDNWLLLDLGLLRLLLLRFGFLLKGLPLFLGELPSPFPLNVLLLLFLHLFPHPLGLRPRLRQIPLTLLCNLLLLLLQLLCLKGCIGGRLLVSQGKLPREVYELLGRLAQGNHSDRTEESPGPLGNHHGTLVRHKVCADFHDYVMPPLQGDHGPEDGANAEVVEERHSEAHVGLVPGGLQLVARRSPDRTLLRPSQDSPVTELRIVRIFLEEVVKPIKRSSIRHEDGKEHVVLAVLWARRLCHRHVGLRRRLQHVALEGQRDELVRPEVVLH